MNRDTHQLGGHKPTMLEHNPKQSASGQSGPFGQPPHLPAVPQTHGLAHRPPEPVPLIAILEMFRQTGVHSHPAFGRQKLIALIWPGHSRCPKRRRNSMRSGFTLLPRTSAGISHAFYFIRKIRGKKTLRFPAEARANFASFAIFGQTIRRPSCHFVDEISLSTPSFNSPNSVNSVKRRSPDSNPPGKPWKLLAGTELEKSRRKAFHVVLHFVPVSRGRTWQKLSSRGAICPGACDRPSLRWLKPREGASHERRKL